VQKQTFILESRPMHPNFEASYYGPFGFAVEP
jgi:hypothetical protein